MDKNIADVNSWFKKRMNLFRNNRDYDKLKILKGILHKDAPPGRSSINDNVQRDEAELDHYRFRLNHLRNECNALYKDLITLRKDKLENYEDFAKNNTEAILQMIYEIHRAEEEIGLLEREMGTLKGSDKFNQNLGKTFGKYEGAKQDGRSQTAKEFLTPQQMEAKEALRTLKEIVTKLKIQLASFHNYVSAMNVADHPDNKQGDWVLNSHDNRRRGGGGGGGFKKYDPLLKELGIRIV